MRSRLPAGRLFQRIKIEQIDDPTAVDAAGQPSRVWVTLPGAESLPAEVVSVAGGEKLRGRQVAAETTVVATVRYRSGIDATQRVVYESGTYGIVRAHDPYGDRREMRIEMKQAT